MDGDVRIVSSGRLGLLAILLTVFPILALNLQTASLNGDSGGPAGEGVSSDSRFLLAKRVVLVAGSEGEDAGEDGISNTSGD